MEWLIAEDSEDCDGVDVPRRVEYECRLGDCTQNPAHWNLHSSSLRSQLERLTRSGFLKKHYKTGNKNLPDIGPLRRLNTSAEYEIGPEDCDGVAVLRRQLERLTRSGFLKNIYKTGNKNLPDIGPLRRLNTSAEYEIGPEDCDGVAVLRRVEYEYPWAAFSTGWSKSFWTEYEIGPEDCDGVTVLRRSLFFFFEILFGVAAGKMNLVRFSKITHFFDSFQLTAEDSEDCDGVTVLRRVDLYSSSLRSVLKFLE
ncbi:hypothetical protein PPACK8108_LOCUS13921 [Phakopsora pachyrhizi]|uniref:Uncharacterized protein n=1 Tax=Phakopsora pachyrhizi TaxID=170000 RepID=A0AAV0B3T6_PHAPC|nr:hypothetical protein PPACK8108_LOCUS13921 [Phakopsora pachyrhizi]